MKLTYGSIKGSDYRIIDVSIWMDSFEFPGNPEWNLQGPFNRVPGKNPEYVYDFNLCTQTGTHIQGPHYFTKNGKKISEFPMDSFEGWAHILDVNKPGADITSDELKEQLHDVDLNDKILIIRSGHMEELIKRKKIDPARRPGLSLEGARYLSEEKGIKMIAIDSLGVESRKSQNFEVNVYLCTKEILILECLSNLYKIKSDKIWLEAYPLKISGVEGTPCREIIKEFYN